MSTAIGRPHNAIVRHRASQGVSKIERIELDMYAIENVTYGNFVNLDNIFICTFIANTQATVDDNYSIRLQHYSSKYALLNIVFDSILRSTAS